MLLKIVDSFASKEFKNDKLNKVEKNLNSIVLIYIMKFLTEYLICWIFLTNIFIKF